MFKTRLISGIILVIIALTVIMSGGTILFATLLAVSLIGLCEFYRAVKIQEESFSWLMAVGCLGVVSYYLLLFFKMDAYIMIDVIFILASFMLVYVFSYPKYRIEQVSAAFFGVFYVAIMLSYVYQTRNLFHGEYLVWLIFICSWGSDTCAYCVGMLIGKHKMAPKLSPKKSIEGAIGGVAGAALLGGIYGMVLDNYLHIKGPAVDYAVICAVGALVSMVGDLAASAIKRNYGVKDYGTLIPGHGGIMDRFDSVIFTAPIIYYLATVLT